MITGLTVLKNATTMGYPWVEAILSVIDICEHFHIGEGYSADDTYEVCLALQKKFGADRLSISRFAWPVMSTGFAIGAATNAAMDNIRGRKGKILYVQGDELWHPDNLPELAIISNEDYEGYNFRYLHLEHNCQVVQEGAGYDYAIRMVANMPHITSHRDAWTFEGCKSLLRVNSLPKPLVHCNYFLWDNVPIKKAVQAAEFYADLGNYKVASEDADRLYKDNPEPPAIFTNTTSPFAEYLPPIVLPLIGQRRYRVREELLR